MPNRLASETSPYLKQHENNPVDWYPWGEEALSRARDEDKPILLSVGYSTCHWCHVMAHESFEDAEIARLMNDRFVCIKVDREEMPDVDSIYQHALQLQGEHGGWPLTMFLLPDGTPFYGGTYFPKTDRFGRIGFPRVLSALADAYRRDRGRIESNARQFLGGLAHVARHGRGRPDCALGEDTVDRAAERLAARIDPDEGGFEGAPKFPNPKSLELVLRGWRRARRRGESGPGADQPLERVALTLRRMAAGGIYDHLGGGFARYSTDARWLVPHFEKMLYDNAQLLALYAEAHQASPDPEFVRAIDETAAWMERDLRAPEGGLYTAMDADSEGVEGLYYVWTPAALREVVGEEAAQLVERCYDVREGGNWRDPHGHGPSGSSILHIIDRPRDDAERALLADAKVHMLAARYRRVPPITDDKVLASSNGLAIAGLAEAGRILGRAGLVDAARRTAEFVLANLGDASGRLRRSWKHGEARRPGTLDDHAYVADGLIALYEASGEGRWLDEAYRLTALCLELFWSPAEGVFYMTAGRRSRAHPAARLHPRRRGARGHERVRREPGAPRRRDGRGALPGGGGGGAAHLPRRGGAEPVRLLQPAGRARPVPGAARRDRARRRRRGSAGARGGLGVPAQPGDRVGERRAVAAVGAGWRARAASAGPLRAWVCRDFTCERPETDPAALATRLQPATRT